MKVCEISGIHLAKPPQYICRWCGNRVGSNLKLFEYVSINGKKYKVGKKGISIQIPEIVDGKLKGEIKVV